MEVKAKGQDQYVLRKQTDKKQLGSTGQAACEAITLLIPTRPRRVFIKGVIAGS